MGFVFRAVIFTVLLAAASGAVNGKCPQFVGGRQVGTIECDLIDEASGIAASRKNAGVLWVHNDSGDPPRVFAMNSEGKHLGIYRLGGAGARDWEDIAIGSGPDPNKDYLYIGDIGDNAARHSSVTVYRVPEPGVEPNQSAVNTTLSGVETIKLQYPDGPRNAETLMVDPTNRDICIISKEISTKVYRAAYPQSTTQTTTMEQVATLPLSMAVGGDISSLGDMIIVRGYNNASIWLRPEGANLRDAFSGPACNVPLVLERQGEGICFDAEGCGYYTISEGWHQPIYYFARDGRCPSKSQASWQLY